MAIINLENGPLEEQFEEIFVKDPILKNIYIIDKKRENFLLLNKNNDKFQLFIDEYIKLLNQDNLMDIFESKEEYSQYLKNLNESNEDNLEEILAKPIYKFLNNDYKQALKGTTLFLMILKKHKDRFGLALLSYCNTELMDIIKVYENDKLKGSNKLLSLSSFLFNEFFKKENKENKENLSSIISDFDSLSKPKDDAKQFNVRDALKSSINKKNSVEDFLKNNGLNNQFSPHSFDIEKSPIYKQNEKIIDTLKGLSEYLILYTEQEDNKIKTMNKQFLSISNLQIKSMEDISSYLEIQTSILNDQKENLDYQNKILEQQVKKSDGSSKSAFKTAMWAIGISIVSVFIGIFSDYLIYNNEKDSDDKFNKKLTSLIKSNNSNSDLNKLNALLLTQNKYLREINTNSLEYRKSNDKLLKILQQNNSDEVSLKILEELKKLNEKKELIDMKNKTIKN